MIRGARKPHWHHRTVTNAADTSLSEPRDTQAYQRLVDAIARRRPWLQPRLDETSPAVEDPAPPLVDEGAEIRDDLGADHPLVAIGAHLPAVRELRTWGQINSGYPVGSRATWCP